MARTIFFILLAFVYRAAGQGLSKYFDPTTYKIVDITDHLDPKFTFTLKGKSQAFMNEGLNEYLEGNHTLAIANFNEVIKLDSNFWPAYYYRGLSYKNTFRLDTAEIDLLKTISKNKGLTEGYLELGEIYFVQRKFSKAKDFYDHAITLNTQSPQGHLLLGHLYLARGEENRAVRQYEKCNEINARFPDSYFIQGLLLYKKRGKKEQVMSFFNRAIEADTTYKPAIFFRGVLAADQENYERAIADWNKLIRSNPNDIFTMMMRAYAYIELNRADEAYADVRRAVLARDTESAKYHGGQTAIDKMVDLQHAVHYLSVKGYGLKEESFTELKKAICYLVAGKKKEVLDVTAVALSIQPSAAAYFVRGIGFEQNKQYDSALNNYSRSIEADKDLYDAYVKRAIYRYEAKNWRGAYDDLNQMRRIDPGSLTTSRISGIIKANFKDYYGCIIDLAKTVKADTADLEALQTKGYCHEQVKDYKMAIEDFQKCIALQPTKRDFYAFVYPYQLMLTDTVGAMKTLRQMTNRWPTDYVATTDHAAIFIQMKSYDSALNVLVRVFDEKGLPRNVGVFTENSTTAKYRIVVLEKYCQIYLGKHDDENALKAATELIKAQPDNSYRVMYRATLLINMSRIKEAKKDLQKLRSAKFTPAEELCKKYLDNK